jgi:hypothetical protein
MAKLDLSVAMGDFDRTRARLDGTLQIDGVDPVYMTLSPEKILHDGPWPRSTLQACLELLACGREQRDIELPARG